MVKPYCSVTRLARTALPTKHCTAASGAEAQPPCARKGGAAETSKRHTPASTVFFSFIFEDSSVWNNGCAVLRGLGAVESALANFSPADAIMRLGAARSQLSEWTDCGQSRGHTPEARIRVA